MVNILYYLQSFIHLKWLAEFFSSTVSLESLSSQCAIGNVMVYHTWGDERSRHGHHNILTSLWYNLSSFRWWPPRKTQALWQKRTSPDLATHPSSNE